MRDLASILLDFAAKYEVFRDTLKYKQTLKTKE